LNVEIFLSGFLFVFVMVTNIASGRFGYETMSDTHEGSLDADAKLQQINDDPTRFKISFVLIVVEHFSIIALAIMLFIAFSPDNMILAVIWTIARTTEAVLQIYNKTKYWGLLNLAGQYSDASDAEKNRLIDSGRSILQSKNSNFAYTQILFSIGTIAYSILFITYNVVPELIGWFGLVASVFYSVGNGIMLVKPNFKALWNIGGLLILLFEIVLGGWLLISSLI
jgi:hypothetical protein